MARQSEGTSYDVVWPLGRRVVEEVPVKELTENLDGKTIGFIWDYLFRGPEMFEAIREGLASSYRDMTFVDYEEFGNIHGSDPEQRVNLERMPEVLRSHRVDAVVAAVGA